MINGMFYCYDIKTHTELSQSLKDDEVPSERHSRQSRRQMSLGDSHRKKGNL